MLGMRRLNQSISFRYSCGDLAFDGGHSVSKVLAQRQSISCESPVEKAYYNTPDRGLKFADVCIHCGEIGSTDFLLRQGELEQRNKTDGKQCYPICTPCLDAGKKIMTYPKKKTRQSQKRKEATAKKVLGQATKKARKSK